MNRIIDGICLLLFLVFAMGWLQFYEGQPTFWKLIYWLGN